jgi:amino acid permease
MYFTAVMAHNLTVARDNPDEKIVSYGDFGMQAIGSAGPILVEASTIIYCWGVSSGYYVLISQNFRSLFLSVYDASLETWVLIIFPVLLFSSLMCDMTAVSKLTPIATIGATMSCFIIIFKSVQDSQVWKDWPEDDLAKIHDTLRDARVRIACESAQRIYSDPSLVQVYQQVAFRGVA